MDLQGIERVQIHLLVIFTALAPASRVQDEDGDDKAWDVEHDEDDEGSDSVLNGSQKSEQPDKGFRKNLGCYRGGIKMQIGRTCNANANAKEKKSAKKVQMLSRNKKKTTNTAKKGGGTRQDGRLK